MMNFFCFLNTKLLFKFMRYDPQLGNAEVHRPVTVHMNYHPEKELRMADVNRFYSLLTPHPSPLTTHYALRTTPYALLPTYTTHYAPRTTHYALRTTHHSLLTANSSLITTHYALLTTH